MNSVFAKPILAISLLAFCSTPLAQPAADAVPPFATLRAPALRALQNGENQLAIEQADQMIKLHADDSRAKRLAGDIYLRAGAAEKAVRQFDAYLKDAPEALPGLWQRGIALYFAGDFTRGVKQFEVHREVNPNDVENAAWHFLCVAKDDSFEKAKRMVLPAPGDPRIPMEEVLQMLRSGDTQAVIDRMKQVPEGTQARQSAEFYGDFYLALYADAQGNREEARRWMRKSAENAPHHYMGDVARVYAEYLADE